VAETAPLRVQLIAKTEFLAPPDVPWSTDAAGGQALVEFAGRACYQSWSKPNPRTATNAGYLKHIIDVGHFSVLEHASVSFYITGISRSCTHELIRHRHFSYSQLSQRYVPENEAQVVVPPAIEADPELQQILLAAADASRAAYNELLDRLEEKFADQPNAVLRRKQARQAARAVLPNDTETRIVVTGNYRAWRHFIAMRASEHADVEIRRLAIACLRGLAAGLGVAAHNLTGDMTDVNYSSARIAELAEREVWMTLQDWFIESFALPVYEEWLGLAMLHGAITFDGSGKALPFDKLQKFLNASRFQGRRWAWVDPSKEADANQKNLDQQLTSRTRLAAEQGDEFEDILDELAQEQAMISRAGLQPAPKAPAAPATPPA